ncbi:MAG: PAC2 family protein [Desulfomonilaceae bacterium]
MFDNDQSWSAVDWHKIPQLKAPIMVAGFRGWSDAGGVSSGTLQFLIETLQPKTAATISDEPFVHYTAERPVAQIEDGIIHELEPMVSELTYWSNIEGDHDLVFLLAREPHFNWQGYANGVLDVMRKLNIQQFYTIGGLQDTISHSGPVLITVVGSTPAAVAGVIELEQGIRAAEYYGPVSIHSYLIRACSEASVAAVSLWGHVPAYLQKSPRVVAKLVSILSKAVGMLCSVESLNQKSIELDRKINEALARDPDLKHLVETIEGKDDSKTSLPGDDKVIRMNDFLRRDPRKDPEPQGA